VCIGYALNTTIHVASISEIVKTGFTSSWLFCEAMVVSHIKVIAYICHTLVFMESLIFLKAVVIAVSHFLTYTYGFQDIPIVAPFANANFQFCRPIIFKRKSLFFIWSEFYTYRWFTSEIKFTKSYGGFNHVIKTWSWEFYSTVNFLRGSIIFSGSFKPFFNLFASRW